MEGKCSTRKRWNNSTSDVTQRIKELSNIDESSSGSPGTFEESNSDLYSIYSSLTDQVPLRSPMKEVEGQRVNSLPASKKRQHPSCSSSYEI